MTPMVNVTLSMLFPDGILRRSSTRAAGHVFRIPIGRAGMPKKTGAAGAAPVFVKPRTLPQDQNL
jgi:hypothetical protein